MTPDTKTIKELLTTIDDWTYVEPRLFNKQLGAALRLPHIQEAFHDACSVAAAGKRWESFHWLKFSRVPAPFLPRQGELLRPIDIETSDWRWLQPPGRPPTWHSYTTSHLCHWLCYPNLLLAQHLFPQVDWCIVSSEKHSTVVNFSSRLVFDLYYSAADVSMEGCLQLLFGDDYQSTDYEIHNEHSYDYRQGISGMAVDLFERIDAHKGDEQQMLKGIRELLECDVDEIEADVETAVDAAAVTLVTA